MRIGINSALHALFMSFSLPAFASVPCGGDFRAWLSGVAHEARELGHSDTAVSAFFARAQSDSKVLAADRKQSVFQRNFTDFARNLISAQRLSTARDKAKQHQALLSRIEVQFGVSPGVLLAFWAFETDFGAVQGDFNTLNALLTLAHDCRRPELFRPQVFAALSLFERGDFDPVTTTGAWAGEIGMVQMLPADLLTRAVDGDGDGRIDLKNSVADALSSGAALLQAHGWRAGEPWLAEVVLPDGFDLRHHGLSDWLPLAEWQRKGLKLRDGSWPTVAEAALLLPQGRFGPAFLAYPNFRVLTQWNQSLVYVTTAAYFANRIEGRPVFAPGKPEVGLSGDEVKLLQERLRGLGYEVGAVDGILGALTREAVRREQARLGLPPDSWPTPALLGALK